MSNRESRYAYHPNIQIDICLSSLEMVSKENIQMEFSKRRKVFLLCSLEKEDATRRLLYSLALVPFSLSNTATVQYLLKS